MFETPVRRKKKENFQVIAGFVLVLLLQIMCKNFFGDFRVIPPPETQKKLCFDAHQIDCNQKLLVNVASSAYQLQEFLINVDFIEHVRWTELCVTKNGATELEHVLL